MRVAVVEPIGRGGMIHYAFQMARGLARAGAEVTLVTDRGFELEGLEAPFEVARPIRLWDPKPTDESGGSLAGPALRKARRLIRGLRWHREWSRLARWLIDRRPDVVQLGDLRFAADAFWVGRLSAAGLVLADVCHNVRPFALGGASAGTFRRSRLEAAGYRRAYRRFDRVFVHYESNRDAFLETYGLPSERVAAIPHGNEEIFEEIRDPAVTPRRIRASLDLGEKDRVILLFGTLAPYKGVDVLIHAFHHLHAKVPDAVLVVAGYPLAGFHVAEMRELADRLGVGERVRLVPRWIESGEVAAWMELADLAVFPYRAGWQSGAVATAATFGVPIVATRVGAMEEALMDGRAGFLVPPEDPIALANGLASVLGDPDLAAVLSGQARLDAVTRGDWSAIGTRLLDHYGRIAR